MHLEIVCSAQFCVHFVLKIYKTLGVLGSAFGYRDSIVYRNPKFKFSVPEHQYPYRYFGPYCSGRGYIMSMMTLRQIVKVSAFIPVIDMEDAYVGRSRVILYFNRLFFQSKIMLSRTNTVIWET